MAVLKGRINTWIPAKESIAHVYFTSLTTGHTTIEAQYPKLQSSRHCPYKTGSNVCVGIVTLWSGLAEGTFPIP